MAHFRGTIEGSRGIASRLGTPKSGLTVKANGWDFGVTVYLTVDQNGKDRAGIYITGGSNDSLQRVKIGSFTAEDLKLKKAG